MSGHNPPFNRHNWPIAAAMIQYQNILPDGSSVQDQAPEDWAATLSDVADAGFTEMDATDSWIRLADLSASRLETFMELVRDAGLTISGISASRRSVIDPERGEEFLAYNHRVIDTAARIGAKEVSFGLSYPLTDAQKRALWFWTAQGHTSPDDPAAWRLAVERIRELGRHAQEVGIGISLEMYEDTYLGSADESVRFVEDVDHPSVGINADLGNLVRMHRPMEHWSSMMRKVAPYARYWHAKNYFRTEDATTGMIVTAPAPLEFGVISYRAAISMALEHGFNSPFVVEHYGGDGLSVSATNRQYLRRILPK